MRGGTNNLDLIRLFLATSVMLWHVSDLSGVVIFLPLAQLFSAELAVKAFFVISGYLVVKSCELNTLGEYIEKRIRRIYPAYAVTILLLACLGALLSTHSFKDYFGGKTLQYVAANLVFLNFLAPTLPGVFEGNRYSEINGALWTLKIEVLFYALVPLVVFLRRRTGAAPVLLSLFACSVAYAELMHHLHDSSGRALWLQLARQLPGQLTYFLVGAACYYCRAFKGRCYWLLLIAGGGWLLAGVTEIRWARMVLEPIWLGSLTMLLGVELPGIAPALRMGDISYGIYIIHFPVIQFFVYCGLFQTDPWMAFSLAVGITVCLSGLSWMFVERPFLRKDSHYRRVADAVPEARHSVA